MARTCPRQIWLFTPMSKRWLVRGRPLSMTAVCGCMICPRCCTSYRMSWGCCYGIRIGRSVLRDTLYLASNAWSTRLALCAFHTPLPAAMTGERCLGSFVRSTRTTSSRRLNFTFRDAVLALRYKMRGRKLVEHRRMLLMYLDLTSQIQQAQLLAQRGGGAVTPSNPGNRNVRCGGVVCIRFEHTYSRW